MNYELLKSVIENEAKLQGVTEYEIYYMSSSELSIDTLNKEPNSFSSGVSGGICLKVVHDGKLGYASSELMEEEEMKSLVSRAKSNAESTEKPDTVGIFKGSEHYEPLKNEAFTAKGAGELPLVGAPGAFVEAVEMALGKGHQINYMPFNAEEVMKALSKEV